MSKKDSYRKMNEKFPRLCVRLKSKEQLEKIKRDAKAAKRPFPDYVRFRLDLFAE